VIQDTIVTEIILNIKIGEGKSKRGKSTTETEMRGVEIIEKIRVEKRTKTTGAKKAERAEQGNLIKHYF
jgi:hypothetical protein